MRYIELIQEVLTYGAEELNVRTNTKTKRCTALTVECKWHDPVFSPRKMSTKIAAAEVAWLLSGTTSTVFLSKYTKIWEKFEDEGNPGNLSTAYGYRWKIRFGRNQIKEAIELLKLDPSTRQCLVMSWDASTDGLMNQGKSKNVPCPFSFNLYIVKGRGRMVIYQRSADIIVGIPYDILSYYLLGEAIFNSVGVPFEGLNIMIGDAHIYEPHYEVAEEMLKAVMPIYPLNLQHSFTVEDIINAPHEFVLGLTPAYSNVVFPITEQLEAMQ